VLPASREWFNGEKVECSINKRVVVSYDKSALVTAGKFKSTDGMYVIRFAHHDRPQDDETLVFKA